MKNPTKYVVKCGKYYLVVTPSETSKTSNVTAVVGYKDATSFDSIQEASKYSHYGIQGRRSQVVRDPRV